MLMLEKGTVMKIEAFLYDHKGNESVVVYNDIDLESIINDLQISFDDWTYASVESEVGTYIVHPDGTVDEYNEQRG